MLALQAPPNAVIEGHNANRLLSRGELDIIFNNMITIDEFEKRNRPS